MKIHETASMFYRSWEWKNKEGSDCCCYYTLSCYV